MGGHVKTDAGKFKIKKFSIKIVTKNSSNSQKNFSNFAVKIFSYTFSSNLFCNVSDLQRFFSESVFTPGKTGTGNDEAVTSFFLIPRAHTSIPCVHVYASRNSYVRQTCIHTYLRCSISRAHRRKRGLGMQKARAPTSGLALLSLAAPTLPVGLCAQIERKKTILT